MSRTALVVVAVLLAPSLCSAQIESGAVGGVTGGVITGARPARDVQLATGRSALKGRVVDAATGQPVRRGTVRINAPELKGQKTAQTDADGRFAFDQLPAGRYSVTATKAAYVNWSYGQTQPSSPGKPVVLADNQTLDNIDMRLPRGAVITGRVVDEFGDPVTNISVTPLRLQFMQGQRRLFAQGGRATTNDIGEFRMFGLNPGQYYVQVSAQGGVANFSFGPGADNQDRTGYAPTYYPGTADISAAQRLVVGLSQTVTDLNITLQTTRLASVSGIAVDAEGHALPAGGVSAIRRGPFGNPAGTGGLGAPIRDGVFTIAGLAPGDYTLRANGPPPFGRGGPPNGGQPFRPEISVANISINGQDLSGVRLAPVAPTILSGRVLFDDVNAAQSVAASSMRVIVQPLTVDAVPGGASPPVNDDFTFQIQAMPGIANLRVAGPGASQSAVSGAVNWQLKSIQINGVDVTDSGVEIGGASISGVTVEMTNRMPQVVGTVGDAQGPVKDYVALLFARDRARWTLPGSRYLAFARSADTGQFKIGTLPPGDYYAIALDRADPTEWTDPDFLEAISRQATPVSLTEGQTQSLELRLFTVQ